MSVDYYAEDWTPGRMLESEAGDKELRDTLDFLRQRRASLKTLADRGLPPLEFERAQSLLFSYDAAIIGLEHAWEVRNRK